MKASSKLKHDHEAPLIHKNEKISGWDRKEMEWTRTECDEFVTISGCYVIDKYSPSRVPVLHLQFSSSSYFSCHWLISFDMSPHQSRAFHWTHQFRNNRLKEDLWPRAWSNHKSGRVQCRTIVHYPSFCSLICPFCASKVASLTIHSHLTSHPLSSMASSLIILSSATLIGESSFSRLPNSSSFLRMLSSRLWRCSNVVPFLIRSAIEDFSWSNRVREYEGVGLFALTIVRKG